MNDVQEAVKGYIPFPCCPAEKKMVFISGHGVISVR